VPSRARCREFPFPAQPPALVAAEHRAAAEQPSSGMGRRWSAIGLRDGCSQASVPCRRNQPQKSRAISARARAQATVPLTLTHSSSAWAPSPGGPNSTVGMPAAAV